MKIFMCLVAIISVLLLTTMFSLSAPMAFSLPKDREAGQSQIICSKHQEACDASLGLYAQYRGEVCFKTGERIEGMNKICYYRCLSGAAAITTNAASLCPLSIRR